MPVEKIVQKLYGGKVQIEFDPGRHTYRKVGSRNYLISVTSATGLLDKSRFLMPWAVNLASTHLRQHLENSNTNSLTREELYPVIEEAARQYEIRRDTAADIGTEVHGWIEMFAKAKMAGQPVDEATIDALSDKAQIGVNGFLDWFNSLKDVKFLQSERLVYSQSADYVGLCDKVLMINARKTVLDYKTGKGIYSEHFYQLSGYWWAIDEEDAGDYKNAEHHVKDGLILHLNKETGEFKPYPVTWDQHQANFPIFLNLVEVKKREKAMQQELASLFKTA